MSRSSKLWVRMLAAAVGLGLPGWADAAVALGSGGWSGAAAAANNVTFTKAADSGSDRALVVVVAGATGTANTTAPTCAGTYGTRSLTQRSNSGTVSNLRKACILTLPESEIQLAQDTTLTVNMSAGTISNISVRAAFFTGVLQSPMVNGAVGIASANGTTTYPSPLAANANGAYVLVAAGRTNATGSSVSSSAGYSYVAEYFSVTNVSIGVHDRIVGAGNESDTVTHTFAGSTSNSALTAIALNAAPTATPPNAPTVLNFTGVGATGLTVTWTDSTAGTAPVTYTVQQGSSGTGPWSDVTGCIGLAAGTQSCAVTGLTGNTTYWYQVVATNAAGSATSSSASQLTLPGQPGTPTFSGTTSAQTTVSWTAPTGGATTYTLERATNATFTANLVTTPGIAGTSTDATGLTASTTYYFRVTAVNGTGSGTVSGTGNVTTLAPSNTIQLVTGSNPAGATVCPGAANVYADQFGFTVTGAADRVSALTVTGLDAGLPLSSLAVATDAGATLSSATPAGTTQVYTFTAPNLAAPVGTTSYRLYFTVKSHAALAAGTYTVTPVVGSYTATNPQTAGTDTAGAFTIDNAAQANVAASSVSGATSTSLTLSLGASAGLTEYVVWARKISLPTSSPVDGTQYAVQPVSATAEWIAYVGSANNPTITGLDVDSVYNFRVFARDACFNYSTAAATFNGTTAPAAQTVTVGNGALVSPAVIAPGQVAWTAVDSFGLTTSSGANTVTGLTYTARTGISANLLGVRFVRASDGGVLGTDLTPSGEAWSITGINEAIGSTTQQYRVEVQPKAHSAMPAVPGGEYTLAPGFRAPTVQGVVTAVTLASAVSVTYEDGAAPDPASGSVVLDNLSPGDVTGPTAAGGGLLATVGWANPADADLQKVVILKKAGSAFGTERPAEGDDPAVGATYGAATVAYAGTGTSAILTGLTAGTWYFKIFARDVNGNFASGAATPAATVENFVAAGDLTPGSNRPVIAILNPMDGAVLTLPAKIQVRAFSPVAGGAFVPAETVTLVVNGTSHVLGSASRNARYGGAATSGVWEYAIPAGAYAANTVLTLRANATNGAGGPVHSGIVTARVSPRLGDGNLLVRDNASQLCSDCHSLPTHGTESAGNKHGSWTTTCRDCHTPHSTTNLGLVRTSIKPPEVNGTTSYVGVSFLRRDTGYAAGAYASPAANGPCQVCHTRTDYFRADGSLTDHNTGSACTGCHLHSKGLSASCTGCHGTEGRTGAAGADTRVAAAPPAVPALATVFVAGGGAHLAHVVDANFRGAPLQCSDCHTGATHQSVSQTDIGWSGLATGGPIVASPVPANGALSAAWTGTPNCTVYCHSNAQPLGGTFQAASPSWTGTADMTCTSCHGSGAAGLALSASHAKHVSGATYAFTCDECHAGVIANDQTATLAADRSLHVNAARDVGFSTTFKATTIDNSAGSYAGSPNYSCSATYCHSRGLVTSGFNPPADPNLSWNGGSSTCGSCHPSPISSNAHGAHVASPTTGSYGCVTCHQSTTSDGASIASYALHVNGARDVTGVTTWTAGTKTCSGNYCHSSGQATPSYTSMVWDGGASLGCNGCHGKTTSAGAPDYANGGAGAATANSHPKHTNSGADATSCQSCHSGFVNAAGTAIVGTSHTNLSRDVAILAAFDGNGATSNYSAGTKTCSAVICHGNASPLGGTATSGSAQWGTTLGCTSCHSDRGADQGGVATDLSAKHGKHLNQYAYTCDECHRATMADNSSTSIATPANHANGTKNVGFSTTLLSTAINQSAGTYSGAATYTCASTYCHSGGVATAAPFSATASAAIGWSTGTSTCRSCHGGDATAAPTIGVAAGSSFQGSAGHGAHVSNVGVLGANYYCGDCHASVVTSPSNTTLTTIANHVNGVKNISVATRGTFVSTEPYTGGQCSATYCHSSGQAAPAYRTVAWTATLGCNGCHGTGTTAGAPDYANGGAATATANSHAAHTANGTDATSCEHCHSGYVTAAGTGIPAGTTHTNGTRNVLILAAYDSNGATANYDSGTKTCSGITCHGASSPVWGGAALSCSSCHGGAADVNNWNTADGTASVINTGAEWTTYGHGNTATTFNEFTGATDRCVYCHDGSAAHNVGTNPFRLRGAANASGVTGAFDAGAGKNGNEVCLSCHDTSNTVANGVDPDGAGAQPRVCQATGANPCDLRIDAWHYGADHVAGQDGGMRCWDCHDPHGDGTNLAMIGSDTLRDGTDAYGLAGTRSTTAAVLTSRAAGGYANTTTRNGVCQVCHTTTSYWRSASEPAAHQVGTDCMTCHDHQQAPNLAFKGAGDCDVCHNSTQPITVGPLAGGTRRAVVAEFALAWSHKRSAAGAVTKWDCIVCHMEGDAATGEPSTVHGNGVLNLRDPDTGANIRGVTFSQTVYNDSNNGGAYTSTGTDATPARFVRNLNNSAIEPDAAAIMINQCLSCHDANGALSALARVPTTGTAEKPFGTTISGANYTGSGITANGVLGGVTDVKASFWTSNASYHPVMGKNNNSYVNNGQMNPPWNALATNKTRGTINTAASWGYLISCWDCHAPTGATSTQTVSVTAHGGSVTVRGALYTSNNTISGANPNLCRVCHFTAAVTNGHGVGSAAASIDNNPKQYMNNRCHICHMSSTSTRPPRPILGQDVHGFNAFAPAMGTDRLYPQGATESYRPYGFMRNVGPTGQWRTSSWKPLSGPGVPTGSATCNGSLCRNSHGNYTPGGVY